jgi:P27 family predicted phage terminase small subunit
MARKPGPAPKDDRLKLISGNPGQRKLEPPDPKREPPPHVGSRPAYTEWWDDDAKAFWRRYVPLLRKLGRFSKLDLPAMEALCLAYSAAMRAERVVMAEGESFISPNGHVCVRPEVAVRNQAKKEMVGLLAEFGMTPRTRGAVKPLKGKPEKKEGGIGALLD